jgi:cystathionine beta-lyase/cystathionine gamma-synthase
MADAGSLSVLLVHAGTLRGWRMLAGYQVLAFMAIVSSSCSHASKGALDVLVGGIVLGAVSCSWKLLPVQTDTRDN